MLLLGNSTSSGVVKTYLPILKDITNGTINGSTIKQYNSTGYNGQSIKKDTVSGQYVLTITNVEAYAMVEMISSNCQIMQSYFA